jgi:hypothetical protein
MYIPRSAGEDLPRGVAARRLDDAEIVRPRADDVLAQAHFDECGACQTSAISRWISRRGVGYLGAPQLPGPASCRMILKLPNLESAAALLCSWR